MQTGFISSDKPWSLEQVLDVITFSDITCLDAVTFDIYGAWDEEGFIIINGISFALPHCNWWLPHPSWEGTDRYGEPYVYTDIWGNHFLGHRGYDFFNFHRAFNKTDLLKIIQSSSDNHTLTIKGGIRDIGNLCPDEFSGGADGHIDFIFKFKSKRH